MKKVITGLVFVVLGFLGQITFIVLASNYGMNLNIISTGDNMIDEFVSSYNYEFE